MLPGLIFRPVCDSMIGNEMVTNGWVKTMDGDRRRRELLKILQNSMVPVSGNELASMLNVSRQVIVQDIALLRAVDREILATSKGYVLAGERKNFCRVFCVSHRDEDIYKELCDIVDFGGKVRDVIVEHDIYGQISAGLLVSSRWDAKEFVRKLEKSKSETLKMLTNGVHYHTVEAEDERILDEIEQQLEKDGFLVHKA